MMHELIEIMQQAFFNQQKGLKNVLATVVHLQGSSYRKPGVRMLISDDFKTVGAVSGGCVEKEIIQQAKSVFNDSVAKVFTYDGRYRLGCEGTLYILLEPFVIKDSFLSEFVTANSNRETLQIVSYFKKADVVCGNFGSIITFTNNQQFSFTDAFILPKKNSLDVFRQVVQPAFKLIIIGAEHDAVKLCKIASTLGWQIQVITSAKDSKKLIDFPGATSVVRESPETIQFKEINLNCAIIIMNHSYVQDLKYVLQLQHFQTKYIGILGAPKRRERLFNDLLERVPEISEAFLETIYAPAGLHIGAQTPEEIAVSIIAEILAVTRNKEPFYLKNLNGKKNY